MNKLPLRIQLVALELIGKGVTIRSTAKMLNISKNTVMGLLDNLKDSDFCLELLFNKKYPNGVFCKNCERVTRHSRLKDRPCYYCSYCGNHVYPCAKTIFQDTTTPLNKWFQAIIVIIKTKGKISSRQLGHELGVTVKTSYRIWFLINGIINQNKDKELTFENVLDWIINAKK